MKLVALDLDGTLLNSKGEIPPANKQAVRSFHKRGGIVVVASGRAIHSAKEIFAELMIDGYVIASNGACIAQVDCGNVINILKVDQIADEVVQKVFNMLRTESITLIASSEARDKTFSFGTDAKIIENPYTHQFNLDKGTNTQESFKEDERYIKLVLTIDDEMKLQTLQKKLAKENIKAVFSGQFFLEIMPENVNKGTGLQFLCDYLGIEKSDSMAFGDHENDIDMLKVSGVSVAMQNALPDVIKLASKVTTTNDDSGVAHILENIGND